MRGTLPDLAERFAAGVRGEIVIVLQGAPAQAQPVADAGFAAQAAAWAEQGKSVREIRELLQKGGLRKNDAYELALRATTDETPSDETGLAG